MAYMDDMFGNRIQLYSESGYLLRISEDGDVYGTQDMSDIYTKLELSSGDIVGSVKIRGIQSNRFLCIGVYGQVWGDTNRENTGTTFLENFVGSYNTYESRNYQGYFIGLTDQGLPILNPVEHINSTVKFLPMR
ncbi:fibroblast growth factor 1-like [Rhynchophorus ferrugineus]|uniref:fibroblast growth factor 1-like n=1 Tax=Rhynchophorus ferrugineus TaxID=354439 RepID=UPI003FCDDCB8